MLYESRENKNTAHQTCGTSHNGGQSFKNHAGTNQPVIKNTFNTAS